MQNADAKPANPVKRILACIAAGVFLLFAAFSAFAADGGQLRFEISLKHGLVTEPQTGRLIVVLSRSSSAEPISALGRAGLDAPFVFARDVDKLANGESVMIDNTADSFPIPHLADLPPGDYFAQALLDSNIDTRMRRAPGNLYSEIQKVHLSVERFGVIKLVLSGKFTPERAPEETAYTRFVKIQSRLLSEFHGRPIYLRAGIILPRDYNSHAKAKYPLWVRIGGLNSRCASVNALMAEGSEFRKAWLASDAPQMILLELDGAGPYGDPYQVNSANNGPYGDAITQELIPLVEKQFRAIGEPHARVLSGLSTGGWASLALQVFYPDYFNGTWTFCPDGIDFRAFELVDIYGDQNAYTNRYGFERPCDRALNGDIRCTMRREVGLENVLGRGNSWTLSGDQWGAWNSVYGPRGTNGLPLPLWDPLTGSINHDVAKQWRNYDLRLIMESNWKTLGPKLRGKLHISVGDADNYYLNNGVHLLDQFLSRADPPYEGRILFGAGKGHAWMDITYSQMMKEMAAATGPPRE